MKNIIYQLNILQTHILCEYTTSIEAQWTDFSFHYEAGQYVEVLHDDGMVSPLSIACAPRLDHTLTFHLYHPPENLKAQALLAAAMHTKHWLMRGPFGTCTLSRLQQDLPIIFIAYGTGFAPIKAVLEALLTSVPAVRCAIYWVVADPAAFYAADLLAQWQMTHPSVTVHPIFHTQFADKAAVTTHLIATLREHHHNFVRQQVYVSGPRPLVVDLFDALSQHGLARHHFYSDVFW